MTDILLMERFPRGRPVREIRTPVNTRNCPRCDNGEGEVGPTSPLPSCGQAHTRVHVSFCKFRPEL
jgi:hypothetical protein